MPFFMVITCFLEILGKALGVNKLHNDWVYNIYLVAEAGFTITMYGYLINKYVKNYRLILFSGALLIILYIYEISVHGVFIFNNVTTATMSVLFIGYGLYYYYLLMKDEDYLKLKTYPPFWWIAGALLFYFGSTASDLYYSIVSVKIYPLFTSRHFIYIYLNIILYGFWSYSFICRYRQRKSIQ